MARKPAVKTIKKIEKLGYRVVYGKSGQVHVFNERNLPVGVYASATQAYQFLKK